MLCVLCVLWKFMGTKRFGQDAKVDEVDRDMRVLACCNHGQCMLLKVCERAHRVAAVCGLGVCCFAFACVLHNSSEMRGRSLNQTHPCARVACNGYHAKRALLNQQHEAVNR